MVKGPYGRKDRLIKEKRHDTYRPRQKMPEPTMCTDCGALFAAGRWSWKTPTGEAYKTICPACRRIADKYPAGHIEIRGTFFRTRSAEITNLMRNIEKQEKAERPLERIMWWIDENDRILVTTTGVHLARRIGEALSQSYQGDFSFQYGDGEKSIRVFWQR